MHRRDESTCSRTRRGSPVAITDRAHDATKAGYAASHVITKR
jgi:hypothetical protein